MNRAQEADIVMLVKAGHPLPSDLAAVLLRELDETRCMLESCRKERGELQQMVWRKAK